VNGSYFSFNSHFKTRRSAHHLFSIYPRWCQVYAKGHENKDDYEVGDWILVSHGRWSRSFILEQEDGTEVEIRKIDINEILAVSNEKPNDIQIGEEIDTSPDKAKAEDFGAR